MTQVSRKGFVDKNGNQVSIVPNLPGATADNFASFDEKGNLQDSGRTIDQSPTTNSANLVTSGGVKTSIDEAVNNIHTLEYKDNSYESRIGVGQLNRDDDELDGATIYGKDAIRIATTGGRVYVDATNIANLQCALKTPSSAPENDATKLITSKAVYDAFQEAEGLTVDSALSPSSTNPVQNKVVSDALAGKMDALDEIELRFDSQGYYSMHAHVNNLISFLSKGPQLVVVKCSIDTNANQIVNVRAIGSLNIYHTEHYDWEIELRVGETLFGRSFTARDTQEAEEAIDSMFDDYGAGAQVSKMNVTLFPSGS